MPHTYTTNLVHCVFSTKERVARIPPDQLEKLWAYVFGIAKNHAIEMVAIGGTENHLHVFIGLPSTMTLADAVRTLKANSSRWMRERRTDFGWQEGYGAFSVSPSNAEIVKEYIRNQREHHKRRNFEEEFVALLKKSGVDYDPRYVFD
jgi:putative transposase